MPVPISITHPKGAGLAAARPAELPTEGPFARLARLKEAQQQQDDQQQQQPSDGDAAPPAATPGPGSEAAVAAGAGAAAGGARADGAAAAAAEPSILVDHLDFSYPGLDGRPIPGQPPLITDMTLSLAPGSRCLLIGANGAGKTTLLKILGGKHMVQKECVSVLGRPPFHDTSLTTCGDLAYIGGNWTRDIAFAGTAIPLTGDFPASKMIESVPGVDPARRARLIKVLDIDPAWRMHQVSDGQRRRVLLLDEITVDLDVLGRADLMAFLAEECRERGAAIIYATHIFDGLESWPTHLAYVARGRLQFVAPAAQVPQLREGRLLELVAGLLREERDALRRAGLKRDVEYDPSREGAVGAFSYAFNNGWTPGVLSTSLANSSNAVMRC
ncbi:ABC transporter I family protein [Raphidocelis subcapitata]|uniref:ABC transporter I family protein n=1 Tax=Raphidocelis subcapitata TaxID=307507 RepID=A0A2V0NX42_9CHLO|nr:ABC transporter I family protein [Raphidocelis subcapitata]|eukprot:GBF90133.1 ABC transporter I family protein [Raphidocelis subcapitata]